MYSKKTVERALSDVASALRAVFPKNGPKMLARLMSVPVGTAHEWWYRNLSSARCRELALRLLDEMDAQDRRRAELRHNLQTIAGQNVEIGGVGGRVAAEMDRVGKRVSSPPVRRKKDRPDAGGMDRGSEKA